MSVDVEWLGARDPGSSHPGRLRWCGAADPAVTASSPGRSSTPVCSARTRTTEAKPTSDKRQTRGAPTRINPGRRCCRCAMDPRALEVLGVICRWARRRARRTRRRARRVLRARLRAVTAAVAPAARRPTSWRDSRRSVGRALAAGDETPRGGGTSCRSPARPAGPDGSRCSVRGFSSSPRACRSRRRIPWTNSQAGVAAGFWALPAVRSREVSWCTTCCSAAGPGCERRSLAKVLHPELAPDVARARGAR